MIFNCQVDFCLYDIHLFERVLRTWLKQIGFMDSENVFSYLHKRTEGMEYVDRGWFLPTGRVKTNLHYIFKTWPTMIFIYPQQI